MVWSIGWDIFNINILLINLFLEFLNIIFFSVIYMEVVDIFAILNLNFYLKVDKILKYILLLNIYINMVISRIIINETIEAGGIININKGNIDSIYMD